MDKIKCFAGRGTFQLTANWHPSDPITGFGKYRACQRHAIRRRGKVMCYKVSREIRCPRT